jgi:aspartyl-tRNA(Asn)/glutamyl-tRNA(Gln) amidotransferase subunit A
MSSGKPLHAMSDPTAWSMSDAARALKARQLSADELLQSCLQRIAQWQPQINAFVALEVAPEARTTTRAAQTPQSRSNDQPLRGIPLAHKDMFNRLVHGVLRRPGCGARPETHAGPEAHAGRQAQEDVLPFASVQPASVLQRLSAAGALHLGPLNMAEYAYGPTGHNAFTGDCRNPWNTDYITGGSSSGSAAAVAAGLVFAALGSDTGGSIRAPAAICGVTGLKPTWGRVSRTGAMPLCHSLDTIGPLARSAEDCARLLALIAGPDGHDPLVQQPVPDAESLLRAPAGGLRLGVARAFIDAAEPAVAAAMNAALQCFRALGVTLVEVPSAVFDLPHLDALSAHAMLVLQAESSAQHAARLRVDAQHYSSVVRGRLEAGFAIPAAVYLETLRFRAAALRRFCDSALQQVHALLLPAMPITTPTLIETGPAGGAAMPARIDALTRWLRGFNYLGVPALVLPCGQDQNGLPIGMQLVARPYDEAILLGAGQLFQSASEFHRLRPKLRD